jgi:hypothetical protein
VTRKIREILREGPATAAEVAERLGIRTYAERRRVREALAELMRGGEVERDEGGSYHLQGRAPSVQEKLWRVVGLRAAKGEEITAQEAALLAEASRDYAKRYLAYLARSGWLLAAGRGRWRWHPERTWLEAARPHWCRRRENRAKSASPVQADAWAEVEDNLARAMAYLEEAQVGLLRLRQEAGNGGGADPA